MERPPERKHQLFSHPNPNPNPNPGSTSLLRLSGELLKPLFFSSLQNFAQAGSESQCHPPCGWIKDGVMKLNQCVPVNQTSTCPVVGRPKVTRLPTNPEKRFSPPFSPVCCQEEDRRLVREERTYYFPLPRSAAPPSARARGESPDALGTSSLGGRSCVSTRWRCHAALAQAKFLLMLQVSSVCCCSLSSSRLFCEGSRSLWRHPPQMLTSEFCELNVDSSS